MARFEAGIVEFVRRVQRSVSKLPAPTTVEERREFRELMSAAFPIVYPDAFAVRDRFINAPGRMIAIRTYRPKGVTHGPAVVFFHGGGFVSGSIYTHDVYALGLAENTGAQVISVNYRLAPENAYPAPLDDCYFALCWIVDNAASLGIDAARIAVGGDSAGGTLTAACTLMARDKSGPSFKFQYLIFPTVSTDFDGGSYRKNVEDPFLSREDCMYYWGAYLDDRYDLNDPYAVPMRAKDLSGLPPAYVLTADHDPLCEEGEQYGQRLRDAGVPTTIRRAPGTIHGFIRARFVSKVAEEEVEALGSAIRTALGMS